MHARLSIDQLCFPGSTIDEFVAACATLGAHHVVLTSPQLLARGGADSAHRALVHGPAVAAVNHAFAVHPDLELDDGTATARLLELVPVAASLGASAVYLLTGSRGSLTWPAAAARFRELIAPATELAAGHGVQLLVETASALYADIHIAHSLADTIDLAESADLGVCLELQFCWAEAHLDELIRRVVARCGLVQVSDYVLGDRCAPGRAVPGDGVIPLERIVADLSAAGYRGFFDIELLGPRIDDEGHLTAVSRAVEHMDALLDAAGA